MDMKKVLILGAGLSASSLIRYLLEKSTDFNWQIRVVDSKIDVVRRKMAGHPNGVALSFNATDSDARRSEMEQADLIISMLACSFSCRSGERLHRSQKTPHYAVLYFA